MKNVKSDEIIWQNLKDKYQFSENSNLLDNTFVAERLIKKCELDFNNDLSKDIKTRIFLRLALFLGLVLFPMLTEAI